jgi:hypothetical protein
LFYKALFFVGFFTTHFRRSLVCRAHFDIPAIDIHTPEFGKPSPRPPISISEDNQREFSTSQNEE